MHKIFILVYIFLSVKSHCTTLFQHKEFEEIHARWRRRDPLIVATTATQQLSRRLPVEVIRDPVIENEIDPFEDGNDRNHQVLFVVLFLYTQNLDVLQFCYQASR